MVDQTTDQNPTNTAHQPEQAAATGTAPGQAAQDAAKSAAHSATDTIAHAGEAGADIRLMLIEQAEQNVRHAFAALRAASQARDVAELVRIQGDYLREQGSRSVEQARLIGERFIDLGRETVERLAEPA